MTRRGFIQKPVNKPTLPESVVRVPDPGEISRPPQQRPPTWVWVLVFVVMAVTLMVILFRSGARQLSTGSMFIFPVMIMSALMMTRHRGGGAEKTKPSVISQTRADYMRKLDELREDIHRGARDQAAEIAYHHPKPADGALLTLVNTGRMWERGPDGRNFGHVRMGVGISRLQTRIEPPTKVPPPEYQEPITSMAARDFLLAQNVVHDVARPLHLFDQKGWSFFAEPEQRPLVQGLLRALVCQLCVFHAPDVVRLAVVSDDSAAWEWAKWLPHVADPEMVDASGPARLIFGDVQEFVDRFGAELRSRPIWSPPMEGGGRPDYWMVVVVDLPGGNTGPIMGPAGHLGLSVLEATGDQHSALATATTAYVVDEVGNLLRAKKEFY